VPQRDHRRRQDAQRQRHDVADTPRRCVAPMKRPGFGALLVMCERPVGRHGLCSSRLRARRGV
jgi:hypothetical protein